MRGSIPARAEVEVKFVSLPYKGKSTMATLPLRQSVQYYIDMADDKLLKMIKALVERYRDDTFEHVDVEQYNRELEASERQIEAGNFHTQEQVRQVVEAWEKE